MEGKFGIIKTEKVKEYVFAAQQTLEKLSVQFERHGGTDHQKSIVKLVKTKLISNKCRTSADYDQLAELRNISELDELGLMPATIEQDKWTKHLNADLSILGNYAMGLVPTVPDPTRKQLLNSQYWSPNIDIFADENEQS
jgi:hypothetical protein